MQFRTPIFLNIHTIYQWAYVTPLLYSQRIVGQNCEKSTVMCMLQNPTRCSRECTFRILLFIYYLFGHTKYFSGILNCKAGGQSDFSEVFFACGQKR